MKTITQNQYAELLIAASKIDKEIARSNNHPFRGACAYMFDGDDGEACCAFELTSWNTNTADDENQLHIAIDAAQKLMTSTGIDGNIEMYSGDTTHGKLHTASFMLHA